MSFKPSTKPRGPDFLVIGAQRAGTSWLHFTLKRHSALWLPPIKEIHHFDNRSPGRTWANATRWRRVWGARRGLLDWWMIDFLLGDGSDSWYARLFHEAQLRGRIAGEITPAYATLTTETFCRIHKMNPQVKIIFVMRDPVQRAWSSVKRSLLKRKEAESVILVERALDLASRHQHMARSSYTETIKRIESVFHSSHIYFCFFDDLAVQPANFVAGILSFLEVNPDEATKILRPAAISPSSTRPAPVKFEREMAKQHLPMIHELCDRFEGAPQRWLARYEKLLAS
jgi:Sulfotransferase family